MTIFENEDNNYSHSYRHYSPEYFQKLIDQAETEEDERELRATLHHVEDGRFYDMLDAVHRMVFALDPDEREDFFDSNPRMKTWINIYAEIDGQKKFD